MYGVSSKLILGATSKYTRHHTHPGGEVDDVGRLVLLEYSLGGLHVPQVAILAAEEDVLLVLLGLCGKKKKQRKNEKKRGKEGPQKLSSLFCFISSRASCRRVGAPRRAAVVEQALPCEAI